MKKTIVAALSVGLGFAAISPAFADTYLVVTNHLNENITIDGNTVKPGEAGWTPLSATIRTEGGNNFFTVKDANKKNANGNWIIAAKGPTKQTRNTSVRLGFGQIGCVMTEVLPGENGNRPFLNLHQVATGVCSSRWWQVAGKPFTDDLLNQLSSAAKSIEAIKSK